MRLLQTMTVKHLLLSAANFFKLKDNHFQSNSIDHHQQTTLRPNSVFKWDITPDCSIQPVTSANSNILTMW